MKILVVGASGLIGSAVTARLAADRHEIVGVVRPGSQRPPAASKIVELDLANARDPAVWLTHLADVAAVINCAGTLQDGPREDTASVHLKGPSALFRACEQAGVRRVIHFSAIGVEKDQPSNFRGRNSKATNFWPNAIWIG
jgi:uncharacterized protein YbjT (DUF2867 family)